MNEQVSGLRARLIDADAYKAQRMLEDQQAIERATLDIARARERLTRWEAIGPAEVTQWMKEDSDRDAHYAREAEARAKAEAQHQAVLREARRTGKGMLTSEHHGKGVFWGFYGGAIGGALGVYLAEHEWHLGGGVAGLAVSMGAFAIGFIAGAMVFHANFILDDSL